MLGAARERHQPRQSHTAAGPDVEAGGDEALADAAVVEVRGDGNRLDPRQRAPDDREEHARGPCTVEGRKAPRRIRGAPVRKPMWRKERRRAGPPVEGFLDPAERRIREPRNPFEIVGAERANLDHRAR